MPTLKDGIIPVGVILLKTVTLTAAAQDIDVSGLTLAKYSKIELVCQLKDALSTNNNIALYFNNDLTDAHYRGYIMYILTTGVVAAWSSNNSTIGQLDANGEWSLNLDVYMTLSGYLAANSNFGSDNSTIGGAQSQMYCTNKYDSVVADLTDIKIRGAVAGKFAIGSTVTVYGYLK